jgi:hypothetical protein
MEYATSEDIKRSCAKFLESNSIKYNISEFQQTISLRVNSGTKMYEDISIILAKDNHITFGIISNNLSGLYALCLGNPRALLYLMDYKNQSGLVQTILYGRTILLEVDLIHLRQDECDEVIAIVLKQLIAEIDKLIKLEKELKEKFS